MRRTSRPLRFALGTLLLLVASQAPATGEAPPLEAADELAFDLLAPPAPAADAGPEEPGDASDAQTGDGDLGVAHSRAAFPTLAKGVRGNDVKALQRLLRQHGASLPVTGNFDATTESAVKAFQTRKGLAADGIVGPLTWGKLVVTLRAGSKGAAVNALQAQLNAKHDLNVPVTGTYDKTTLNAVKAFQRNVGITADGIVGPVTWTNLLWHFQVPEAGAICGYSPASERWGTAATAYWLKEAAQSFALTGNGLLALGDVSLEHGGPFSPHVSHQTGMDADIRPVRTDSAQCAYGTTYTSSTYDQAGTRALAKALRATGKVKALYFNDPVLIREGLASYVDGHHDHLHVRYCSPANPDARYRC